MKKLLAFVLALVMVFALCACGQSQQAAAPAPAEDKTEPAPAEAEAPAPAEEKSYVLTFTTASVPEEAHTRVLVEYVVPRLEELSGGRLKLEVFDSSSLFSQDDELPATIKGNASMCYTDGSWLATYMPSASMFSAGYMFTDLDHMNAVMNGEIGQEFFEQVAEEVGVRCLCCYYIGSRCINLRSSEPVMTPADLKGVKLRMPNSEAWLMLGKALGADPVPVAFSELYTALSTGVVDGQDNPLTSTEEGKFYEVTGSISITNHQIGALWPCINEELWEEMGEELQGYLLQAFEEGVEYNNNLILEKENSLIEFFESEGLKVGYPDVAAFKEQVLNYYLADKEFTKDWDMDLYEKIQALG
ncbi:MAG: DctP family TRAP transporter solute-binding subunit [Oscillospiraceae bacterium]|nr:DctP family TRAP transporter solute-binding subunit [Oscillospiraceae bacterium]